MLKGKSHTDASFLFGGENPFSLIAHVRKLVMAVAKRPRASIRSPKKA